jgi:NADPH-dependent glutamate synthase beta subunit-like oxidoreductase
MRHYDAVVFAYGASKDKKLGVPNESELRGIYSAREFVGWYNGLPEYANMAPDLTQGEEAVIIGQGNVALDVARMMLENVDVLRKSDITEAAIETLSKSRIKRVHVVGRRGPMQVCSLRPVMSHPSPVSSLLFGANFIPGRFYNQRSPGAHEATRRWIPPHRYASSAR